MKLKARIAVFVSGGGTNLQALIDAQKSGKLKSGEITLVISSNPDAYALQRAQAAGIRTLVIKKRDSQEDFERNLIEAVDEDKTELIILAGFMNILSARFTGRYPRRIINVHPSLIPSFCGKGFYGIKVHQAALDYGVKVSGATVHFVNEIPDGGEIILQKAIYIYRSDTPETLQKRIMEKAEWILLPRAAEKISREIIRLKGRL